MNDFIDNFNVFDYLVSLKRHSQTVCDQPKIFTLHGYAIFYPKSDLDDMITHKVYCLETINALKPHHSTLTFALSEFECLKFLGKKNIVEMTFSRKLIENPL